MERYYCPGTAVVIMEGKQNLQMLLVFMMFFVLLLLRSCWQETQRIEVVPYSSFQSYLDQGKIDSLVVSQDYIHGILKEPDAAGGKEFVTSRVDPTMAEQLRGKGVAFSGEPAPGWLKQLVSWIFLPVVFITVWVLLSRWIGGAAGAGGGFLAVGKSKAKVYVETGIKTTFQDVAGVDEAKAELVEIVRFLKDPQEFGRLGARVPKGALLVGPPGTGKTLLARAVAGEAGVPFFSTNGSEFVEMFVGVGAARVRDLFEQARRSAPAIIFIDELDALGRARGIYPQIGGHDEKEQTLNQLLAELDGFDPTVGLVLLAATNRPEVLDPALLRAGRFDRQILVDRPDKSGRLQILVIHVRRVALAEDVDLDQVAAMTPGFTGADLANLVNEAAMVATRRDAMAVGAQDFIAAIERLVAGLEKKSRILNPVERRVVAFHEMGHALVAMAIPGCDPVQKVSIIPRGIAALGYTIQRPTEDRFLMSRRELENKMAVLLAGRAAETLMFDDVSTGAADDLVKATDIARGMVMRYGMDAKLGPIAYDTETGRFLGQQDGAFWMPRRFSEDTAHEIDCAVRDLTAAAFDRAVAILRRESAALRQGAELLLERETLAAEEIPHPAPVQSGL